MNKLSKFGGIAVLAMAVVFTACPNETQSLPSLLGGEAAISGAARAGDELTAITGGVTGAVGAITIEWQRSDSREGTFAKIAGSPNSDKYTQTADDVGKYIRVSVTSEGTSNAVISDAIGPVLAQGAALPTITVNFDLDDGASAPFASIQVEKGKSVDTTEGAEMPGNPARSDGHTFDGWYTEKEGAGTPFTSSTIVNDAMAQDGILTVYAKWNPPGNETDTLTVTFNPDNGSANSYVTVRKGKSIDTTEDAAMPQDPSRDGFRFEGWFIMPGGTVEFKADSIVTSEITVRAKWHYLGVGVSSYKILALGNSYGQDAMMYMYDIMVANGVPPAEIKIANACRWGTGIDEHYRLASNNLVYNDANGGEYQIFGPGATFSVDRTKTLKDILESEPWDIVTMHNSPGGSGFPGEYSETYRAFLTDYIKEHCPNPDVKIAWHMTWAFGKNAANGTNWGGFGSEIAHYNGIITQVTNIIIPDARFDFVIPAGTAIQNARGMYDSPITKQDGNNFSRDDAHLNNMGMFLTALTWLKRIYGFDLSGFSSPYTASCSTDSTAVTITLDDMEKLNKCAEDAVGKPLAVTEYPKTFRVAFDPNNSEPVFYVDVEADKSINTSADAVWPADPSLDGYTFDGWFIMPETTVQFTAHQTVNSNLSVMAKYTIIPIEATKYRVTFEPDDGSLGWYLDAEKDKSIAASAGIDMPQNPVWSGYQFEGWFKPDGTLFNENTIVTDNITVTARWTPLAPYRSIAAAVEFLATAPGGGSAADPIDLEMQIPINSGTVSNPPIWREFLAALEAAEKYVNLDLTLCTYAEGGTTFQADRPGPAIGKKYIVSLKIPAGTTAFADQNDEWLLQPAMFVNFANLKSVFIPKTVTSLGARGGAFMGLSNLQEVIFEEGSALTTIPTRSFTNSGLRSIIIPAGVTTIPQLTFNGSQLASVIFLGQIATIGESAFASNRIVEYELPASITSVGTNAFQSLTVQRVTIRAAAPPTLGNQFSLGTNPVAIYVPAEAVATYEAQTGNWAHSESRYNQKIQPILP